MFIAYIKGIFKSCMRRCYWMYNIFRIRSGRGCTIATGARVEGKGKIVFGDDVSVERSVTIGCALNSGISIGNGSRLQEGATLTTTPGTTFSAGKGFTLGLYSRCFVHANWQLADSVSISTYCHVFSREKGKHGKLTIGENSVVGDFSIIDVSADIHIGKNIAIGPRCTIYTHDHDYTDAAATVPWKGKAVTKPVRIEDGAWIGANVTILPGVTIGENAIVAAGSVITKSIPPGTISAGVPGRVIRSSFK